MSDTPTAYTGTEAIEAAAAALTAGDQQTDATQGNPDDAEANLGDAGKQALDRMKAERNEAKRQAAEFKAKLDQIEAANLSDLERAQREAADAKEAAARATADANRLRLATRYRLTEDEAADLPDDPEKAERLAARLGARQSDTTTATPKPDLTQGAQHATALNGDGLTEALARAVGAR